MSKLKKSQLTEYIDIALSDLVIHTEDYINKSTIIFYENEKNFAEDQMLLIFSQKQPRSTFKENVCCS